MNKWLLLLVIPVYFSCGNKKKQEPGDGEAYFPIKSYLQSQVAHIDTSLYSIQKIVTKNNQSDTQFIKREEFRAEAKDFLSIPDITQDKWRDDYVETKLFDEMLESAVITYSAKEADAEIRRQEVIIKPNANQGDQVKTIFIDRTKDEGSGTIQQKLLWEVNKWFRIVTITQKLGQAEQIQTTQLIWTEGHPAK